MKTLGEISQDLKAYFQLHYSPHVGLGRKVVPVWSVNRPFFKTQVPVDWIDTSIVINAWETVESDLSESDAPRS